MDRTPGALRDPLQDRQHGEKEWNPKIVYYNAWISLGAYPMASVGVDSRSGFRTRVLVQYLFLSSYTFLACCFVRWQAGWNGNQAEIDHHGHAVNENRKPILA